MQVRRLCGPFVLLACFGCADSKDGGAFSGSGVTATDSATGGSGDTNETGGGPPPEDEGDGDFRVPRASGRFVYSASQTTDSVAVIDSQSLAIDVVGVGGGPTVVAAIASVQPDHGAVAVLDQASDDVAIVRTDAAFATTVEVFPVTPGANNLAVSGDGVHVFVFHDVDGPEALGPGSDQELTVIDTGTGQIHEMTVGAHPRDVRFSSDGSRAWVVNADGINVIVLDQLGITGKPILVPVVPDPGIDPATIEVQLSATTGYALARVAGETWISVTNLADGSQFQIDVGGIATDLDVSADGSFAIATLPAIGGSRFVELPLPLDQNTQPIETSVDGEYVGLAQIAPDGGSMVLYTTVDPFPSLPAPDGRITWERGDAFATTGTGTGETGTGTGETTGTGTGETGTGTGTGETGTGTGTGETGMAETGEPPPDGPDPRRRVTIARRNAGSWNELLTLFIERPVTAVGMAPDGRNAMLLHDEAVANVGPYAYTLIDLVKAFPVKKTQLVPAAPGPILFTPDGDRAAVLLRRDPAGVREVDLVDLRSFIVDELLLGSPPEGAGYVDATAKIYVSQEHPTGRITFIDAAGNVQTITGFQLNDAVKD